MNKDVIKNFFSDPANVRTYYESELNGLRWNGSGQGIGVLSMRTARRAFQ